MHRYGGSLAFEAAMHETPTPSMTVAKTECLRNAVLADSIVLTVQTVLVCSTAVHTPRLRNPLTVQSQRSSGIAPM